MSKLLAIYITSAVVIAGEIVKPDAENPVTLDYADAQDLIRRGRAVLAEGASLEQSPDDDDQDPAGDELTDDLDDDDDQDTAPPVAKVVEKARGKRK